MSEATKMTAGQLCETLFGEPVASLNRGTYPGTNIPLRQVSEGAPVFVSAAGVVTDTDGGWIADRFCASALQNGSPRLGLREARRVLAAVDA